jgi:hypothetical protein
MVVLLRVVVDDEQVSDERPADPGLVIPNDDPRCRCYLAAGAPPLRDGTWIATLKAGAAEARVHIHMDCVHHGPVARQIARSVTGGYSIGGRAL